jgi:hypothetical protein
MCSDTLAASTAYLPLLYDTVVVFFTIKRTAGSVTSKDASQMLRVLLREGLLFYGCVGCKTHLYQLTPLM